MERGEIHWMGLGDWAAAAILAWKLIGGSYHAGGNENFSPFDDAGLFFRDLDFCQGQVGGFVNGIGGLNRGPG